ncbi:hypothetical protein [Mesorhizobium sp. B2-3-15]|uniref:hypothetical protein n=1 Tax=Mesorhizobium sp. B2-3-15 TaxID=2589949 RepID=UPI0011279E31|nr:hypothetical protein [Mesorhizobium sp. B2-3-15]TPL71393.1 hypothetical protein FJ954_17430 [Mesorhizobium sp. B2-3-15]
MAFTTGYFIIVTKSADFDSKKPLRLVPFKEYWCIEDKNWGVGDIFVCEREDAARRLFDFKKICSRKYGHETSIRFARTLTRAGAAKKGFAGEGEIIEHFRPTREEAEQYAKEDREKEFTLAREDLARYREIIDRAHRRFPKIDQSAIPAPWPDDPTREVIHVDHYVCGLARCGAISEAEMVEFRKSLKTGYSDHRFTALADEIVMVPND